MITISTTLTGWQIGEELASDAEELAYCLTELSSDLNVDEFWQVAEHTQEPEIVGPFLRALADAIDPPVGGGVE